MEKELIDQISNIVNNIKMYDTTLYGVRRVYIALDEWLENASSIKKDKKALINGLLRENKQLEAENKKLTELLHTADDDINWMWLIIAPQYLECEATQEAVQEAITNIQTENKRLVEKVDRYEKVLETIKLNLYWASPTNIFDRAGKSLMIVKQALEGKLNEHNRKR
jgi:predicted nuclease with TOPRIM domain